jgi:hypothetical protein
MPYLHEHLNLSTHQKAVQQNTQVPSFKIF